MPRELTPQEIMNDQVSKISRVIRNLAYVQEQITRGSEDWRINANLYEAMDEIQRYLNTYPTK